MKPADLVKLVKSLKELGATRVVVGADGSFDVQLSGGGPRLVPANTAAMIAEREREERNAREAERLKNPEEAPADSDSLAAWRKNVMQAVGNGG